MKKNIAIVAGGDSSEIIVSLKSAAGIFSFIDEKKYHKYIVLIEKQKWQVKVSEEELIDIDKNDFSFIKDKQKIKFDFAYITIHGTPGENGILQAYFELIDLPYSTCGVLSSALTFNKFACNHYLKGFGVKVADSLVLRKGQSIEDEELIEKINLPCFIKPNVGGSSFGVSKVNSKEEIQTAIKKAFEEGEEVMIEKLITGLELTCGIYKTKDKEVIFPITEIIPKNDFFDFDAKYNGQVTEITPARISKEISDRVQKITSMIYDIVDAKGIIRIDYILSEENVIYLLEVNTTPGMTPTSFIPQQVKAASLDIKEVMDDIITNELKH